MASTTSIVLWDLETCFPSNIAAPDAVAAIRRLAAPRSTIQQMLAFWNSNQTTNQAAVNDGEARIQKEYRNALHRQGVQPVDSAFLDGESVVKAMLVEMFKGIIDGRFRTVVVISNSTSLEYAVNQLKDRQFRVNFYNSWASVLSAGGSPDGQSGNASPSSSPVVGSAASLGLPDPTHGLGQADHPTSAIAGSAPPPPPSIPPPPIPPPPYTVRPPADVNPEIIQKFHVLIEVFESLAERGETRITRANLGNEITRHSTNAYREAGFKDFKKYVQAAESFGLVIVGGGGSEAWVELRSDGPSSRIVPIAGLSN